MVTTAEITDKGYSIGIPATWDTLAEPMAEAHRLVITWQDAPVHDRTVTYLTDDQAARDTYEALAECKDAVEVLWQTRGKTGRPRFVAVRATIHTTLPI
jgi:hypothetical protein